MATLTLGSRDVKTIPVVETSRLLPSRSEGGKGGFVSPVPLRALINPDSEILYWSLPDGFSKVVYHIVFRSAV